MNDTAIVGWANFILIFIAGNIILYALYETKKQTEEKIEELRKFVDSLGQMQSDHQEEVRDALRDVNATLGAMMARSRSKD